MGFACNIIFGKSFPSRFWSCGGWKIELFSYLILPNIACSNASLKGKKEAEKETSRDEIYFWNCHLGRLRRQIVVREAPSLWRGGRLFPAKGRYVQRPWGRKEKAVKLQGPEQGRVWDMRSEADCTRQCGHSERFGLILRAFQSLSSKVTSNLYV